MMGITTSTTGLGRRRFLFFTAGAVASVFAPWTREPTGARLARLFDHRESARAIGRAWLDARGGEASGRRLVDGILADLGGGAERIARTRDRELKALLEARIHPHDRRKAVLAPVDDGRVSPRRPPELRRDQGPLAVIDGSGRHRPLVAGIRITPHGIALGAGAHDPT